MGPAARAVLARLADGGFQSGEQLARAGGVTRAAIWKQVRAIRATGLAVESVPGKGYRLPGGLELLDANRIRESLGEAEGRRRIAVVPVLESTNRWLVERHDAASGDVCLAEMQTAGRGRRGRHWVSPFGASLYLSMVWRFQTGPAALGGLSLAIAVAAVRALESLRVEGPRIKWPNDLYWKGRKLAGTLVEVSGESTGPSRAVVGVGVNMRMPPSARAEIDQPWAELRELPGGEAAGRNELAAAMVREWDGAMARFAQQGLAPFLADFRRLDLTRDRAVTVETPSGPVRGTALGVDDQGRLRVRRAGREQVFADGAVSLRMERGR